MENVLVTGGAGFIGSNFIQYLQRVRPEINIFNLDALTYAGNLNNLKDLPHPNRYKFIQGDICDIQIVERVFHDDQIDTVIHFAAESHVDRSIKDPLHFMKTNIMGTVTLLNAAVQSWNCTNAPENLKHRFHHISTDEVFGSLHPHEQPFSETTPYSPNSPYAASKAASDLIVRSYFQTYNLPITITNCSNNYGPYQFPEKLIPLMIQNAIQGQSLPVYGDGKQIRDWLFVEDHCEAILRVLEKAPSGETYNIGGNNQPLNLDIIRTICELLDEFLPDSPYKPHFKLTKFVPDRPGHDRRYAMDISKIQKELGWQPKETLESGLRRTVKWYIENDKWVQKVIQKPDYQNWLTKNYTNRQGANK
jgi:dTDP-glucose 4,6-dehydratase